MTPTLCLTMADYVDTTRWRWVLTDASGRFLADHQVRLDPTSHEYRGFLDLRGYLDYYREAYPPEQQLADLGAWIGAHVFGGVRAALWEKRGKPAVAVRVLLPAAAEGAGLLLRPFELARFADGTFFREAGIRFVYEVEPAPGAPRAAGARKAPAEKALRVLAAFSLPAQANPLNLRRERYGLQRLVRELAQTRGAAVELRVLQYGATRDTLKDALEEAEGWDVVHLSCHGAEGALLLEDERGQDDLVGADELGELLDPACARLKLLILDACYSGAGAHAAARAAIGLDREPTRSGDPAPEADEPTVLPGLAQALSARLDCAALAMRYPVEDGFATDLMLALYAKLLDAGQPLPAALHLALDEVLKDGAARPPLSAATPILVGARAAELPLAPPRRGFEGFDLPPVGLGIAFPPEPPRFVGRLQPMLRASQALAPRSDRRGVLFYGMPGAGKTACALELAYRHAEGRFQGYVWYHAPETGGPEAGGEITNELYNLLFEIERQLNAPGLGLTAAATDDPARFRAFTLPRLKALLGQYSLLLVLDNLETLLAESGAWRDALWGDVVEALLSHTGPSRAVLTSRRAPAGMERDGRLQVEAIHALSLAESVLLARELPHLGRLFGDEEGRGLLQATLRLAQGHPKLLELADGLAADRAVLAARLAAAADEVSARAGVLDVFFATGGAREGETRQDDQAFTRVLRTWTGQVAGALAAEARLLLQFLCRLEAEDRRGDVVEIVWPRFLERLAGASTSLPEQAACHTAPARDVVTWVGVLEGAGLVAVTRADIDPAQVEGLVGQLAAQMPAGQEIDPAMVQGLLSALTAGATTYTVHPGVAEAVRSGAAAPVLDAVDVAVGDYFIAMYQHALRREMEGAGGVVVSAARRAAPYLLRQARWQAASMLLDRMLLRDPSPASLGLALPLLRRIAAETAGTERALIDAGVLAGALLQAGRTAEAEARLRDIIEASVTQGNYRTASAGAGELVNLLRSAGRLGEALQAAAELAEHTRRAGLGPWKQLLDETMRLQVLAAMGRYDEVLAAVQSARPRMEALPDRDDDGVTNPWNVRETLLDTGMAAAVYSGRWEMALALNAEVVAAQEARGAGALEVARRRFNDYSSLLRLGRAREARALLMGCRSVYEAERYVAGLGKVYTALAQVEDRAGNPAGAVRFEQVALGYKYRAGQPEDCAISHHNLANYLARQGAGAEEVLAQRLADAIICYQTQSGSIATTLRNLARSDLPPVPPTFDEVSARVEASEGEPEYSSGVRFRELFARLPRTAPDGDAAIAAVWGLVGEEKRRQEAWWAPRLARIAAAAKDEALRGDVERELVQLEQQGWLLAGPARRIWAGERDAAALTAGLDAQDSALVRRVLELVGGVG